MAGWNGTEKPPHENFNWFWKLTSDWTARIKDVINNSYAVQHNLVSGAHGVVTATSVATPVLSINGAQTVTLATPLTHTKRYMITQQTNGTAAGTGAGGSLVDLLTTTSPTKYGTNLKALELETDEHGAFPFDVGTDGAAKTITLYFKMATSTAYAFNWELVKFFPNTGLYDVAQFGGVSGSKSGSSNAQGFETVAIDISAFTGSNGIYALRVDNTAAAKFSVFYYSVAIEVSTLPGIIAN